MGRESMSEIYHHSEEDPALKAELELADLTRLVLNDIDNEKLEKPDIESLKQYGDQVWRRLLYGTLEEVPLSTRSALSPNFGIMGPWWYNRGVNDTQYVKEIKVWIKEIYDIVAFVRRADRSSVNKFRQTVGDSRSMIANSIRPIMHESILERSFYPFSEAIKRMRRVKDLTLILFDSAIEAIDWYLALPLPAMPNDSNDLDQLPIPDMENRG